MMCARTAGTVCIRSRLDCVRSSGRARSESGEIMNRRRRTTQINYKKKNYRITHERTTEQRVFVTYACVALCVFERPAAAKEFRVCGPFQLLAHCPTNLLLHLCRGVSRASSSDPVRFPVLYNHTLVSPLTIMCYYFVTSPGNVRPLLSLSSLHMKDEPSSLKDLLCRHHRTDSSV